MKWSDNDDNWRDWAEAHPAQVERIKEAGRQSGEHPAQGELPDGLREHEGVIQFQCENCQGWSELPIDVADFEPGHPHNVCGKSPRCCP